MYAHSRTAREAVLHARRLLARRQPAAPQEIQAAYDRLTATVHGRGLHLPQGNGHPYKGAV